MKNRSSISTIIIRGLICLAFISQNLWAQKGIEALSNIENLPYLKKDAQVHQHSQWDALYIDGNGEYVLSEAIGPGCVYNFWCTIDGALSSVGNLKIYIDDEKQMDMPIGDYFSGETYPFVKPLVEDGDKAYSFFVPLPFQESMKITVDDISRMVFHVIYHTYPTDEGITSWTGKEDLSEIIDMWNRLGNDPKDTSNNAVISGDELIPAGQSLVIADIQQRGVINSIKLNPSVTKQTGLKNLILKIYWDDQPDPGVLAPVNFFFGSGYERLNFSSLMLGMKKDYLYNYFPMPFWSSARIEIENNNSSSVTLPFEIQYSNKSYGQDECGYFYARYNEEMPTQTRQNYTVVDVNGTGHFVGMVFTVYDADDAVYPDENSWMEGDEVVYIDDNMSPFWGSGSEDYFLRAWGFQYGAFPLFGVPSDQYWWNPTAYRIHIGDCLPFKKNLAFYMEHGESNFTNADVASLAFYYAHDESSLTISDELDIGNDDSESLHNYTVSGENWNGIITSKYRGEDDTIVKELEDDGRAFSGYSEFTVTILPENNGVLLRRRINHDNGQQKVVVYVDDQKTGVWYDANEKISYREYGDEVDRFWRDIDYNIPAQFTSGKSRITIRLEYVSAEKNRVNEFYYWIYNHINSVTTSDETPPNAPRSLTSPEQTESSISLVWQEPLPASDGETASFYSIERNGIRISNVQTLFFEDTGLQSNTSYNYSIYALDAVKNSSASAASATFRTKMDSDPPAISGVNVERDDLIHILFNEPLDQTTAETVSHYSIDNNITVQQATLESEHSVILSTSPLLSDHTYQLTVKNIKDVAGNSMSQPETLSLSYSGELEITNLNAASRHPYTLKNIYKGDLIYSDRDFNIKTIPNQYEGLLGIQTANDDKMESAPQNFLTFEVNQPVTVLVGYDTRLSLPNWLSNWQNTGDWIESDDQTGKNQYQLFKSIFPRGQVALGPNNAQTNSSNMYIVLIEKFNNYDQSPPIISNIQTLNIGLTSATVTWTTNEPTYTLIEYGKTNSYGYSLDENELKTSHQLTLTNLQPATAYHFRITSKDADNNQTVSNDHRFNTMDAAEQAVWHSYHVVTTPGKTQAEVKDHINGLTAYLEFYESTDKNGVQKGELFKYFFDEQHKEHLVIDFWTSYSHNSDDDEAVPYVGKSTAPRGSLTQPPYFESNPPEPTGVYDIKMHSPKNNHSTVMAFIAPADGDYTISNLACRRDNEWMAADEPRKSVRYRVFDHNAQLLCDHQYVSRQYKGPWLIIPNSYQLNNLKKNDRIYFTLHSDGDWGWDKTDVTWTVSAMLEIIDKIPPEKPTGLSVN